MDREYKGVPEGASAVIPRLFCEDVESEIHFCCEALGAVERGRRPGPDGRAAHAMLTFGSAMLMIDAIWPSLPTRAPNPDGSSPVVIYLYIDNVDAAVERVKEQGGKVVRPAETQFWGDRIAWIQDPAGHMWTLATRVEETTEDQRRGRWENILSKGQ